MAELSYREALNRAMDEELARDPDVFIMGEEVGLYQGAYKVTKGLMDKYGESRVVDTPITEAGFVGVGIGAAMCGLRPVIELMTWNFSFVAYDQIVNNAAKLRYMSGGALKIPIVFRGPQGAAHQLAAQHSQSVEPLFCYFPGLTVIAPSTPRDAYGLLKTAIRDDNPVIFLESEVLYNAKGPVEDEEFLIPIGKGEIKREGADVTIIAWNKMLYVALTAAERLSQQGISAEVVDPRTLRPLDDRLIFNSVRKTNHCVIVEEAWPHNSVGCEISDRIHRHCFDHLDAPVARVNSQDVPMPYAKYLEHAVMPEVSQVIDAVKQVLYIDDKE